MISLWKKETVLPSFPKLEGRIKTDVLIIGGGMAGILCSYELKKYGIESVIVDAGQIAMGVTGNTTAKITSQHGLIYNRLTEQLGRERAWQYALANERAVKEYAHIVNKHSIKCAFEPFSAFCYSEYEEEKLYKEVSAAKRLGIAASFKKELGLPFAVKGAVCFEHQAQFQPLDFISGIIEGMQIYENSRVIAKEKNLYKTAFGEICADVVIVATHFPIFDIPGFYFTRMHQEKSYVIALKNAADVDGMYISAEKSGYSFRNYGEYLLLGGEGHRTGCGKGGAYSSLKAKADIYYPKSTVFCGWSAQDCMTHDGVPFIGRYSAFTPNMYVATGFNKWGMSSSMAAARILSDMIRGERSDVAEVFSPMRVNLEGSIKNFTVDMGSTVKNKLAGMNSPKKKRCSHMGCELKYNSDDGQWECPCHGSVFQKEAQTRKKCGKTSVIEHR